ncbi:helix-turn-helix domain-containing protein [Rhizobium ruizarguesonis]|uniref:helix-turn-helix domain-containing protein n=1 Tax=Rhizobium ruizarguesonis TaxID=2081791 RepID=UPI00046276B6|nr:helix-turn-helix domain-containing protein [Rhizobium ruizarguesonis]MBY5851588.1 helix-turn-helix domain-containing protein [Rhizobium leguminosarum]NKL13351.1 helix-turn-helix domain-containing protein [Rhizobium leguminosarum bv. viciae]MBY5873409.1 helix-turn-helix domain-containing protein [Rhizobium leguminosarum]MBY5892427.1 helix-turn-helix domain-containing protein [Rhizobium leguminosarum]NEH38232.1 helix-turn-helix domain-containing protein [Rhizobium ruizarguesonis]
MTQKTTKRSVKGSDRAPAYSLYGESPEFGQSIFSNAESILVRSNNLQSNIDLHVHLDLYQFVYISEGRSTLISPNGKYNFGTNSLVMIPPNIEHGFYSHIETKTFGHVITLSDAYFDRLAQRGVLASDLAKYITIIEQIDREINPEVFTAIERVIYEHSSEHYPFILAREAAVLSFIVEFLRLVSERNVLQFGVKTSDIGDPSGKGKIEILSQLIDRYYKTHKNVQFYADRMNMSVSNLNKISAKATGKTVHSNIRARNLEQARSYLANTNLSVKEISFTLGYEDAAYFTRFFKTNTGLSPIAFRRLSRRASPDGHALPIDQI